MGRLTISLSDERHLALKEAAARQHKSIREIIENSLDYYGIKTKKSARDYVAMARRRRSQISYPLFTNDLRVMSKLVKSL